MAAVVRLKRHLDDEPLSALILNCKKRKKSVESEADSGTEVSTVLTFAGTVNNQEDDFSSHISKITKEDIETSYKRHIPNITSKIRHQTKITSEDNRFKIVNFFRSINKDVNSSGNNEIASNNQLPLTVLDVESADCISENTNKTDLSDYVYDLYYTNSEGIDDSELDSDFKISPANEIIFDDGTVSESDHDTDDSNDENNWRNDYPDEESNYDGSIGEDEMQRAVNKLSLNDDLSSDDDQEGFMYSIDSEAVGFEEDLDNTDHNRYGEMFARFKRGQKREEEKYNKDLYHEEIDDTDEDFYD